MGNNNNKKTRIKIKKSKYNLYNKKKSKSRQALTLVLTVAAACVLGVVGYGIGKPIMNYLQTGSSSSSDNSGSPGEKSSEPSGTTSESIVYSSEPENSSNTSSPDPVVSTKGLKLCVLSPETVTSSASLNSALAAARESGCETVAVTLKDEQGFLYYSTDIEGVKGTELVHGTLSAAQICDYITKAGMTPAVKISTLKDSNTPIYFGGYHLESGTGWVDKAPDAGGKRWLSPFSDKTSKYIGELTSELSAAGFRHIICANIMYPTFHNVDATTYLSHLPITERGARLDALWNVADAAKSGASSGGAHLWIELDGSAFLAADKFATDAEIAARLNNFDGIGILADYTMENAEGAFSTAFDFSQKIKTAAGGNDLAVLIKSGPSGAVLADIQRAFDESEIQTFIEK